MIVKMHQAKTRLSEFVERALSGEEIVIARDEKPLVRLMPIAPPDHPRFGAMAETLAPMQAEAFRPWSDEELQDMGFDAPTDEPR